MTQVLFPTCQAVCDSGATHALRPAADLVEWNSAQPVHVSLAGKETVDTRLTLSGTRLLPPTSDAQTIVHLGVPPSNLATGWLGLPRVAA